MRCRRELVDSLVVGSLVVGSLLGILVAEDRHDILLRLREMHRLLVGGCGSDAIYHSTDCLLGFRSGG